MISNNKTSDQLLKELQAQNEELFALETRQQQTEEKMREMQDYINLLASALEHSSQPFAAGYPDGGILLCNDAFCELTGYTKEELKNLTWSVDLTPPEWRDYEAGVLETLHITRKPQRHEKEYIRKDGTRVPIEILVHQACNSEGNVKYYYSFITDITDRKKAEAERERKEQMLKKYHKRLELLVGKQADKLQFANEELIMMNEEIITTNEELLAVNEQLHNEITIRKQVEEELWELNQQIINIFESITDAFYTLDHQWKFSYLNSEAERLFGRKREELIGRNIWEEFPALLDSVAYHEYQKAVSQEIAVHYETLSPISNLWIEVHAYPSKDGLSVYFRDITKRKLFESEMARLDRLNLVGEMAASIGHEVRNPMTTVRGFLQLLGNKAGCVQYKSHFDLMIEELDRANSIITEFLALAKNKTVELKIKNLNSIVKALLPLIEADAIKTDQHVKAELGKIPQLYLDEKEIRQLILNLVRNGLEAMSPGKNLSLITFTDGEEVVLAVRDEGKGITNADLEKLGTPFFTTKEEGTGLGLAVCYSIAARHNANIKVETGPGGTTFFVRFDCRTNGERGVKS